METRSTSRGYGISSLVPHDIVRDLAPAAEIAGYAMFWINDLPGASGMAALGVAARAAPTIELGVGMLAVDRWDAQRVAAAVREADIDPRRLTIGIGAGLLTRGSQAAVIDAATGLSEIGARRVVVGSLGPRLTRIGGSDADGVLLNWVTLAAATSLATVARDGASAAGRSVWTAAYTRVACDPAAADRLRAECEAYVRYPAYARHFARFGMRAADTSMLGDEGEVNAWLSSFDGILDHVVVRAIAAADTPEAYLAVLRCAAPSHRDPQAR